LALLAEVHVLVPSREIRIFITVIAYGAGVDYCVFLIDRYREELDAGFTASEAAARAIGHAGGAVSASAATVICGIGMMAFAQFGKIREAGYVIPFCLIIVLCAALTFAPALLRLTGRWVFWPIGQVGATGEERGRGPMTRFLNRLFQPNFMPDFWSRIGPALARRPGLIWLTTVAVMAPFAVLAVLFYDKINYDPLSELPASAPSVAGASLLERHFAPGLQGPTTVLVQNNEINFDSDQGADLIRELSGRLEANKSALAIADLRSLARPLGTTEVAQESLARIPLPRPLAEQAIRRRASAYYVSHAGDLSGHVARLDLVLAVSPFSLQGIEQLDRIEHFLQAAFAEGLLPGSQVYFSGTAATIRNLRAVTRADQSRLQKLVPVTVFLLLLIAFRRPVLSFYLILTVLFSYLATLGATFLIFWMLDPQGFAGLDWKVPLFLFTILVAVGEDYNIFLVSRIDEERRTRGAIPGILTGLARTGRIISTCGFIMAGTFAALFAGSFLAMKELGFALAVGVLLDTLIVRPVLVPTFMIRLEIRRAQTRRSSPEARTQAAITQDVG
ncbi:MAG TPA: MMPL family transporter, partial [Gemmataceae bacterium]|nr:MMPL family transporter [Gemmataceae bacterium]